MIIDTAEQIGKHLPRNPEETVPIIKKYCQYYQELFSNVKKNI